MSEAIPGFPQKQSPTPHMEQLPKMAILSLFTQATAQERQRPAQARSLSQSWRGSSAVPVRGVGERWRHHWDGVSKVSLGTAQGKHQLQMHRLCFN